MCVPVCESAVRAPVGGRGRERGKEGAAGSLAERSRAGAGEEAGAAGVVGGRVLPVPVAAGGAGASAAGREAAEAVGAGAGAGRPGDGRGRGVPLGPA